MGQARQMAPPMPPRWIWVETLACSRTMRWRICTAIRAAAAALGFLCLSNLTTTWSWAFRGNRENGITLASISGLRALVSAVRSHIEREYSDCWVEGEISNLRIPDSGHLYFTLKEESAQIRVVMFRSPAKLLRFRPENGLQVTVRGRITVYEDRGELQISAEFMEPRGAGALPLAFAQLKARLQAEGLFEASRKKAIPPLPQRIGIITSPQGAALRDILNILARRHH